MKFFRKKAIEPDVRIVTKWSEKGEEFYAPGALIEVVNGKGILRNVFAQTRTSTYNTLMLGNQPLFQLQGDEYWCPTCEKILKSGYGLVQSDEFRMEKLNRRKEDVDFSEALEELKPLLGLLLSSFYIVLDTRLYPTDGNGHLFWETPNEDKYLPGTCIYYFRDKSWMYGNLRPYFTVATQPVNLLCEERVNFYRENPGARAVAFFEVGYMTALLDGHHKAMAAAMDHEMVNALVIMPCYLGREIKEGKRYDKYIGAGEMKFSCEEYHLKPESSVIGEKISEKKLEELLRGIPQKGEKLPSSYDTKFMAEFYPTVETVAYIELAGEITNERLDQIIAGEVVYTNEDACNLMKALGGLKHERTMEMADFFLNQFYDGDTIYSILEVLTKLPHTEELEQYLIAQMVEFEQEHSYIKDLILGYF